MSNALKRVRDPDEVDDATFNVNSGAMSGVDRRQRFQQEMSQYNSPFPDAPRQNQYLAPNYMNPESNIPVMQLVDSGSDPGSGILFDSSASNQVSLINLDEVDYDMIAEWGNNMVLQSFDLSQSTPISSQETSHPLSARSDSSKSRAEGANSVADDETICYGMLHSVDVKLVGEMQIIHGKLGNSEAGSHRFKLNKKQDHILLCFHDDGKEFGYLRSGVGKTLAPLLAKPYVEFEPIVPTSNLSETIGRANKPAEAMIKVDINVYGPRRAATEVGDALSTGKLWLQKFSHARHGVVYDNPHFLALKIKAVQVQSIQSVNQVAVEGLGSKKHREEQLRKMVEEVYKSLDNTRHLNMVEGGDRVARKLLKHQQEALGFMLERESGHINSRYRLWETIVLEDGREEYRHRITKTKAKQDMQPDERGGGILADEMGMGKSLSILALIVKTLDDGKEWAQQLNNSAEGNETLKHSRCTLVVVPSAPHAIRRTTTAFYRTCNSLHANSRWCLTGTPIQNKLADIGALFAFIRVVPFSKASVFHRWIELPFEQNIEDPTIVKNRLVVLLEALCLRRTKDTLQLPGLRQHLRALTFSPAESEQYKKTKKNLARTMLQRISEEDKSYNFGRFQLYLQLRLMCNHGTFQKLFSWKHRSHRDEREDLVSSLGQNREITCSGCKLPMPILGSSRLGNGFREKCAHVLCSECIEEANTSGDGEQTQHCPLCVRRLKHTRVRCSVSERDVAIPDELAKDVIEDEDGDYFNIKGHSTKMQALIEDVNEDLWMTKRQFPTPGEHLDQAMIPYLRIDGSCPSRQRQAKLDQFARDNGRPVLIMTTGTGGFGLNLTCANRIFIVEPQWNPAVESQAIARAIRLGQQNEVHVTRYVIKGTIEKDIMSQQQWKKQLAAVQEDMFPLDWYDLPTAIFL
ncbi:hypothetical protein DV736_g1622, partial [Chaetothyriales sp. CBS 134916]